jgi:hypothetical protein
MSTAAISVTPNAATCPAWCTGHTTGPEDDAVHWSAGASIRLSREPDPAAIDALGDDFTGSVEVSISQLRDGVRPRMQEEITGPQIELVAPGNWDGPGVSVLTAAEAREIAGELLKAAWQMEASSTARTA